MGQTHNALCLQTCLQHCTSELTYIWILEENLVDTASSGREKRVEREKSSRGLEWAVKKEVYVALPVILSPVNPHSAKPSYFA